MLMIALKAAVLPIFMRARRKAMIALTRIEYKGRPVVGWTYFQNESQFSKSREILEGVAEFCKTYATNVATERNGIVSGE
jgi:hypothetical protein